VDTDILIRKFIIFVLLAACSGCSDKPEPHSADGTDIMISDLSPEFFIPMASDRKRYLMDRNALGLNALEIFAKPGKFDIYDFDIDVLGTKDDTITFTPFDGPPIEIMSYGFEKRMPSSSGHLIWNGAVQMPDSSESIPVRLAILVRSIDTNGNVRLPDPNRDITRAFYDQRTYTVLEESVNRLSERIVYSLPGNEIYAPETNTKYVLTAVLNQYDFVVVYEVDEAKLVPSVQ